MKQFLVLLALAVLLSGCAASVAPAVQDGAAGLVVSGGDVPKSYTLAELKALPQAQAQFKEVTYTGVSVAATAEKRRVQTRGGAFRQGDRLRWFCSHL